MRCESAVAAGREVTRGGRVPGTAAAGASGRSRSPNGVELSSTTRGGAAR
ncbi:hypothetical protein [Streptomyces enissocaesilis]